MVGLVVAWRREELAAIVKGLPRGAAGHLVAAVTSVVEAAALVPATEAGPIELRVR